MIHASPNCIWCTFYLWLLPRKQLQDYKDTVEKTQRASNARVEVTITYFHPDDVHNHGTGT
jgi:hypothetical protein